DWLVCMVASLSNGQMEEEYLRIVPAYAKGEQGQRPIDRLCEAFAQLVVGSAEHDILGDLFTGAITHGEAGQCFTPEWWGDFMAQIGTVGVVREGEEFKGKSVMDCCCGSGGMLLIDCPAWWSGAASCPWKPGAAFGRPRLTCESSSRP